MTSKFVCDAEILTHEEMQKQQPCKNGQRIGFVVVNKRKEAFGSPKQLGFVWKQLWLDVWFSWKPHDREVMRETAGPALCAISPHSLPSALLMFPSLTFIIFP